MRRTLGFWAVLFVCAMQMGCLFEDTRRPAEIWQRLRHSGTPQGPDVVVIDVAILERPLDDPFLTQGVWDGVDEQILGSELKALFEENGLRIGQVCGIVPPRLQEMLKSERDNSRPRQIYLREQIPSVVALNEPVGVSEFALLSSLDTKPQVVAFEKAICGLSITPFQTENGRVRLRCVPRIEHGEKKAFTVENGNWALQGERPVQVFEPLTWDLTLGTNEYLIVGTTSGHPHTLGQTFFTELKARPHRQLLVIRLRQTGRGQSEPLLFGDDRPEPRRIVPIAQQANVSIIRGASPDSH